MYNYVLTYDHFLFENKSELIGIIKNLKSLPKVGKLYKIPTITKYTHEGDNTIFYGQKYNLSDGNAIRFSYFDKELKKLAFLDFFVPNKFNPVMTLVYDDLIKIKTLDELGDLVSKVIESPKFKAARRPLMKENILYDNDINEGILDSMNKFGSILTNFVLPIFMIYGLAGFAIHLYKKNKAEKEIYSATTLQKDQQFYTSNDSSDNDFKVFALLNNLVDVLIMSNRNALLINGKPGTGKTYTVRKRLAYYNKREPNDFVIVKGSTTLEGLYEALYDYRDRIVIFDDCDSLFKDDDFVNIIKAVTDSSPNRIVSQRTGTKIGGGSPQGGMPEQNKAPKQFVFRGKVIIITNLPTNKIDSAIISRTGAFSVNLSPDEMVLRMERIMKNVRPDIPMIYKEEVFEYLKDLYVENPNARFDLRVFAFGIDDRVSGIRDWKSMIKSRVILNDEL